VEKIDLERLKSHLWESADILKRSVDTADYKNYIFGLLFLKRLSDVFEEEGEQIEKETGDKKLAWNTPDEHEFFIPETARWNRIKAHTKNLGEIINKANEGIEKENKGKLEGMLTITDFKDKDQLPDASLSKLIAHFSKIRLRNEDFSMPDILGRAYEYLIAQFADCSGKKGGEFYTPKELVTLLVEILDPCDKMRICDPTCGSGGMLIQCYYHISDKAQNPKNITLYGQEKNIRTWAICKMNMLLHGLSNPRLERRDTLRSPKLLDKGGNLMEFDIVVAHPPFSIRNWGYEEAQHDYYHRFPYGIPPKGYGDYAFVQHIIAILNSKGRAGIALPHGVLFRGGAEGRIRKGILEEDLLEAIIGLPPNLFFDKGIPASLFIINKNKPRERRGKLFFLYGANDFLEEKKRNKLRKEDIEKIVSAYREFRSIKRYCRPVSLDEIRANEYNLNIARYIDVIEEEVPIDVQKVLDDLRVLQKERSALEEKMNSFLKELGYQV
jgi:type I restriction enzyme M protein